MKKLQKIVITGPESSGKSWLTAKLGEYFKAPYALEYARIFLEENGADYDFDTLEEIISGHLDYQRKSATKANDLLFLDTDLINFKVWEEMVFGKTHTFLDEYIAQEKDHLYILAYPDLPWEEDPLRENKENREEIFELHKMEIEKLGRNYAVITGTGDGRLKNAIKAVIQLIAIGD